jgi:hypothetical protein
VLLPFQLSSGKELSAVAYNVLRKRKLLAFPPFKNGGNAFSITSELSEVL